MNKRIAILLVFLTPAVTAMGQISYRHDSTSYWMIQPSVGYSTFQLGEVNDFYETVLATYKELGLTVPTQKQYPGNVLFGFSVMYNIPGILRVGLSNELTWTKAYSGYEDYAGLLEINSTVSLITAEAVVERDLGMFQWGKIYLGVKGGSAFVRSDYITTISFNEYPVETGEVRIEATGNGYSVEPYLGFEYALKRYFVGMNAGYRIAKVKEIDGELEIPGEGSYSGELDFEHDLSGISIKAKVGIRF